MARPRSRNWPALILAHYESGLQKLLLVRNFARDYRKMRVRKELTDYSELCSARTLPRVFSQIAKK